MKERKDGRSKWRRAIQREGWRVRGREGGRERCRKGWMNEDREGGEEGR